MKQAKTIHFDLNDVDWINKPGDGILTSPINDFAPGGTAWELRTIFDNQDLLKKAVFYRDGRTLQAAEVRLLSDK